MQKSPEIYCLCVSKNMLITAPYKGYSKEFPAEKPSVSNRETIGFSRGNHRFIGGKLLVNATIRRHDNNYTVERI